MKFHQSNRKKIRFKKCLCPEFFICCTCELDVKFSDSKINIVKLDGEKNINRCTKYFNILDELNVQSKLNVCNECYNNSD